MNAVDRIKNILIDKNTRYGNSVTQTYKEWGMIAYLVRLTDKYNRLKYLVNTNGNGLSIKDTLLDIAGYCLLAIDDIEREEDDDG